MNLSKYQSEPRGRGGQNVGFRGSPKERFFKYITLTNNCFEWNGSKDSNGYGLFGINHKLVRAHRFSFELFNGSIPPGLDVLHKCDNPCCVRPDHLFLGTDKDNVKDREEKGRGRKGRFFPQRNWKEICSAPGSTREVAKTFGVSQTSVARYRRGHGAV